MGISIPITTQHIRKMEAPDAAKPFLINSYGQVDNDLKKTHLAVMQDFENCF